MRDPANFLRKCEKLTIGSIYYRSDSVVVIYNAVYVITNNILMNIHKFLYTL